MSTSYGLESPLAPSSLAHSRMVSFSPSVRGDSSASKVLLILLILSTPFWSVLCRAECVCSIVTILQLMHGCFVREGGFTLVLACPVTSDCPISHQLSPPDTFPRECLDFCFNSGILVFIFLLELLLGIPAKGAPLPPLDGCVHCKKYCHLCF
jgi:hypothetical protein